MRKQLALDDLEIDKFDVNPSGDTIVRVLGFQEGSIGHRIMNAFDKTSTATVLDAGTVRERISVMTYVAPSVGAYTVTNTFTYTYVNGKYVYASDTWSVT